MDERLERIQQAAAELARKIDAPLEFLPAIGRAAYDAEPQIEVDDNEYHFVVVERGKETARLVFRDRADILYVIFSGVTFRMAGSYELEHRVPGQDSRRLLFARQLELMRQLDPSWATKTEAEIAEILRQNPYVDT